MLGTFLDKLSGFFDQRFIVIYWFPTFIGLGLAAALATTLIGLSNTFALWFQLNPPIQILLGIVVLLIITVLASLFGTFTFPIVQFYEGYWPENWLTRLMLNHQRSVMRSNLNKLKKIESKTEPKPDEKRTYLFYKHIQYHYFPREEAYLKPTRLGNVLTAAEEYPNQLYRMDAVLWWPRMTTLMPEAFRSQIDSALTPMLITLNLSLVFTLVAIGGEIAVLATHWGWWWLTPGFANDQWYIPIIVLATHWGWWWLALITFFGSLFLARVCYRAAVSQAVNYALLIRVAFDLYRFDVLKQMHIPLPGNLNEERHLWDALNKWIYYYMPPGQENVSNSKLLKQEPFYYDIHTSMQDKCLEAKLSQQGRDGVPSPLMLNKDLPDPLTHSNLENNKMGMENA